MRLIVLLSAYNGEPYIREQLDSLFAQTLDGVERRLDRRHPRDFSGVRTAGRAALVRRREPRPGLQLLAAPSRCAFCDQNDVWDVGKLEITASMLEQVLLIVLSEKQYEGT